MASKSTPDRDAYMLNREFRESARHQWLWYSSLGYNLHPSISASTSDFKVADIGTGNACWLLELAREAPTSWRLEGFDVSALQYPASEYLPSNVSLRTLDAFATIPEDLVGRYDVVHIRAFTVVVRGGDPGLLLDNMIALLKPGGYLQWDEVDAGAFHAEAPRPSLSIHYTDRLLQEWKKSCANAGMRFNWISSLADSFTSHNLKVVDSIRLAHKNDLKKAFTDNWLTALEEAGDSFLSRGGGSGPFLTADDFRELFEHVVKETRDGASILLDLIVVLGRKDM